MPDNIYDPPGDYGPDVWPQFDQDEIEGFKRERQGTPRPVSRHDADYWPGAAPVLVDFFGEAWVVKRSRWNEFALIQWGVPASKCYPDGTSTHRPKPIPTLSLAEALKQYVAAESSAEFPLSSNERREMLWRFGFTHNRIFRMRLAKRRYRCASQRMLHRRPQPLRWKPFPDMPPNPTFAERLQKIADLWQEKYGQKTASR